ncbi:t-SNARE [Gautieria morchelliformis]|nr:t-SNARE [Gautieria morchelliformis]
MPIPASATPSQPVPVTTRSRTLLFFSFRDSTARPRRARPRAPLSYGPPEAAPDHFDEERQGLLPPSPSSAVSPGRQRQFQSLHDNTLPPRWVDVSGEVEAVIAGVQAKVIALDKLHAKHVLPGFADRSAEEREIGAMTSDITRDFRHCHKLIQRITPDPDPAHTFPPGAASSSRHATLAAQNVQRALAAKVQELSATFRKKQRVYMEKLQGHSIKNQDFLVASGAVSLQGQEGIFSLEEDVKASQEIPLSSLSSQSQLTSHDPLHARAAELASIATSITSLADLFKDLSTLVIDQGTILDSVEYNVEMTAVNVQEAVEELTVATRYQKNTGRRQCMFLLVLIILGLVLVLIFKPRRQGSGGGAIHTLSAATATSTATGTARRSRPSLLRARPFGVVR